MTRKNGSNWYFNYQGGEKYPALKIEISSTVLRTREQK